jgi:hypothetical protein
MGEPEQEEPSLAGRTNESGGVGGAREVLGGGDVEGGEESEGEVWEM